MRKLSTLLEGISYRRLELIIGLSYKVLIRYDKGEAVSETNLKIITDFINKCETDDMYKRSLYDSEKTVKESKSTKIEVPRTITDAFDLVNSIGVPTVKPIGIEDIPRPITGHNMNIASPDSIQQQIENLTTITNSILDQLHSILEEQKQLWEHMKELIEIQPVDELIAISSKIGSIEEVLKSTNLPMTKNELEQQLTERNTAPAVTSLHSYIKPEDAYPTSLPDNIPDVMGSSFGPDFYTNLRKNSLIDSQVLPNQTFLDDDILNILPS